MLKALLCSATAVSLTGNSVPFLLHQLVNIHPLQQSQRVHTYIQERLCKGRGTPENSHYKLYSTEYVKVALLFARHSLNSALQKRGAEKENIPSKYSV